MVGIQGLGMDRPDAWRRMGPALWFLGSRPTREAVSEGMLEPPNVREAVLRSDELLASERQTGRN